MKESDKQINESKIKEFFTKKAIQSGHTFENEVARLLDTQGFNVRKEIMYLDKDGEIGRTIDLLATDNKPNYDDVKTQSKIALAQLWLVIECKKLPDHAWVFFGEGEKLFSEPEFITHSKETLRVLKTKIPNSRIDDIYHASTFAEYVYDSDNQKHEKKTNQRDKNLYEAILSVTKATPHHKEFLNKLTAEIHKRENKSGLYPVIQFIQPLIVFHGHMYYANEEKNNTILESIDMVQINKKYLSKNYHEERGTIHIVKFESLEKYLKLLRDHFWGNASWIIESQPELVKILDQIIISDKS